MSPAPVALRVALPVPLPRLFDYLPPPGCAADAVQTGQRVRVPFGSREVVGVVLGHGPAEGGVELRQAIELLDEAPLLAGELLASLRWLAGYLHAPLGEVLATALPAALRRGEPLPDTTAFGWQLGEAGRTALPAMRGGKPKALAELLETPRGEDWLDAASPGWRTPLRSLRERGLVERIALGHFDAAATPQPGPALHPEQRIAADAIVAADGFAPFLLDGVTGSGKTEVYLQAIGDCLARGRQALVLVPEIALTPQALKRFRERLGVEVAALHSGLAEGERARAWLAAARGEAQVILGTRSALFVPLPRPGVIVVDEEHDASYKQQEGFRYHARDLAVLRAQALGVPVVLGSATPSLESLANVEAGRYAVAHLRHRAGLAQPPSLRVIDLRRQRLQHGLASPTLDAIADCLARGEQALVFKNRRGYAPVLLCHDCGWSAQCPHCERALTLHRRESRLRCHHCGYERALPAACPDCGGLGLNPLGQGTERLEEALSERFPDTPIVRVDRDTTRGRRARDALFDRLPDAGARILIGTQMLAKGHDLPHLTLVVVVGVDEGLHSVDFRAAERLGQLVVQVAGRAGRAGRAERPGAMILQTHDPSHPLLAVLLDGGYRALAAQLLKDRRAASLPPFAHFALLRAEAKEQAALDAFLREAMARIDARDLVAHGPLAAPMPRRAGAYRGQILLEASTRGELQTFLPRWLDALRAIPGVRALRWSIDVDPVDLY